MIEAYTKIHLLHPYTTSLEILFDLVMMWDFRLIQSDTRGSSAIIAIPSDKFKTLFGSFPREGRYSIPSGTEIFIEKVEVIDVKVRDEENGEDAD